MDKVTIKVGVRLIHLVGAVVEDTITLDDYTVEEWEALPADRREAIAREAFEDWKSRVVAEWFEV